MKRFLPYSALGSLIVFLTMVIVIPLTVSGQKSIPSCHTYALKYHWFWNYPNKKGEYQNPWIELDTPLTKTDKMVGSISYRYRGRGYIFKFRWDAPPQNLFMIKGKPMWVGVPMQVIRRGAEGTGGIMRIGGGGSGIDPGGYPKVVNALQKNFGGNRNFNTSTIDDPQAYVSINNNEGEKVGYGRFHLGQKCDFKEEDIRYVYFTVRFSSGLNIGHVYYVYELIK